MIHSWVTAAIVLLGIVTLAFALVFLWQLSEQTEFERIPRSEIEFLGD